MSLTLEAYSPKLYAAQQGKQIHRLVKQAQPWLETIAPGIVERYRDVPHAVANVRRIATAEGMRALVIKQNRVAIGVATIVFDQAIVHPEAGIKSGSDLGYWLAEDIDDTLHRRIARDLMQKNEYLVDIRRQENDEEQCDPNNQQYDLIAAVPTILPAENRPRGLEAVMKPFGEPAVLSVPGGTDTYGVTFNGMTAQLYAHSYTN